MGLALATSPTNTSLRNDLAVLQLVRAKERNDIRDVFRALETMARNPREATTLPESAFNRALAFEELALTTHAAEAWADYISIEPSSDWRAEARAHQGPQLPPDQSWDLGKQDLLSETGHSNFERVDSVVISFRMRARLFLEREVLLELANALRGASDDEPSRWRALATEIATSLLDLTGDHMGLDAVKALSEGDGLSPASSPAALRGYAMFSEAASLYESRELGEARARFMLANHLLGEQNPLSLWARYYAAVCNVRNDPATVRAELERLEATASDKRYLVLQAYSNWIIGLTHLIESNLDSSLLSYQAALEGFTSVGELENVASLHKLLAEAHEYRGHRDAMWQHIARSLSLAESVSSGRWRRTILLNAARAAASEGFLDASRLFQEEAFSDAVAAKDTIHAASSLVAIARLSRRLGASEDAVDRISAARRWVSQIPDASERDLVNSQLLLEEGQILLASNPEAALDRLNRAIEYFRESKSSLLEHQTLALRGAASMALSDWRGAESDYLAGAAYFERTRASLHLPSDRLSFFELARSIYDALVEIAVDYRDDPSRALEVVSRATKHGVWPPTTNHRHKGPLQPQDLDQRVAVVSLWAFSGRLGVWVESSDGLHFSAIDASRRDIDSLASRFTETSETSVLPGSPDLLEQLYQSVVQALPSTTKRLFFVPDFDFHHLPLGLLLDPLSGRRLIEDYQVAILPTRYLPPGNGRATPLYSARIGAVVDPSRGSTLGGLRAARQQSGVLRRLFPATTVLNGDQATVARFRAVAEEVDVLHFGGHAVANPDHPEYSELVLAPEAESVLTHTALRPVEIRNWDLTDLQLVVLGACRTAETPMFRLAGNRSLIAPFFEAGAESVLATLWDVDDAASQAFLKNFYIGLQDLGSAAAALRAAQLQALGDATTREDPTWQAFQLYTINTSG